MTRAPHLCPWYPKLFWVIQANLLSFAWTMGSEEEPDPVFWMTAFVSWGCWVGGVKHNSLAILEARNPKSNFGIIDSFWRL